MSNARPRVVYWFESPRPYIVERFNAVVRRGGLDFEAWFNRPLEADRSWDVDPTSWKFPYRWIPARRLAGRRVHVPTAELHLVRPDVFVCEYDRPHLTAGFLVARHQARRTAFRVLPNFDAWSERTWWRELGKHMVFRAVDAAKVPGPDGRRLCERYGLSGDRVSAVTQSIDVDHYVQAQAMSPSHRAQLRTEAGLHGCVFLFVGRLWSGKGVGDLITAFQRLRAEGLDVSLLLVGDGVDADRFRAALRGVEGAVIAGFVQVAALPEQLALADVLVFPTRGDPNGLVVEEAMAAGLPVVVTDAAGDIRLRVRDGESGYVVPAGDVNVLTARLRDLATDAAGRARLAGAAAARGLTVGHARYAEDFERFIHRTLKLPARHTPARYLCEAAGAAVLRACRGEAAPLERAPAAEAVRITS